MLIIVIAKKRVLLSIIDNIPAILKVVLGDLQSQAKNLMIGHSLEKILHQMIQKERKQVKQR